MLNWALQLMLDWDLQAACGILAFFCDPLWGCRDREDLDLKKTQKYNR